MITSYNHACRKPGLTFCSLHLLVPNYVSVMALPITSARDLYDLETVELGVIAVFRNIVLSTGDFTQRQRVSSITVISTVIRHDEALGYKSASNR